MPSEDNNMENFNDLDNGEKVMMSTLIGDTLQAARGLKSQIEQIHKALGDTQRFKNIMEWLHMVDFGLGKMLNAVEGTDLQPE